MTKPTVIACEIPGIVYNVAQSAPEILGEDVYVRREHGRTYSFACRTGSRYFLNEAAMINTAVDAGEFIAHKLTLVPDK